MEKNEKVKIIVEVAVMTAIAFALDFLQGGITRGLFPNGGSIGIAMLPILVLAYRRGFIPALVSGFILSIMQMTSGVYVIASEWYNAILQVLLDYIIAYPLVATAGLFYKKFHDASTKKERVLYITIGTVVGGLLKYFSHVLSGILFWKNLSYAGGPVLYSFIYNGTYMIPNIVLCTVLMAILSLNAPVLFLIQSQKMEEVKTNE